MRVPSSRMFVIVGFTLSLAAVILNSVVLSRINARLKDVDSEYNKLVESLASQKSQMDDGDLQLSFRDLMHVLSFIVPADKRDEATEDAGDYLGSAVTAMYAAANDITAAQVMKTENEDLSSQIPNLNRMLEIKARAVELRRKGTRAALAEYNRLAEESQRIDDETPLPKSELAKNLRELEDFGYATEAIKDPLEFQVKLYPRFRPIIEQLVVSTEAKENRQRELADLRSGLVRRMNNVTYAAIALQIFGLMLILAKDLAREARVRG
jgi:hypothetical protein